MEFNSPRQEGKKKWQAITSLYLEAVINQHKRKTQVTSRGRQHLVQGQERAQSYEVEVYAFKNHSTAMGSLGSVWKRQEKFDDKVPGCWITLPHNSAVVIPLLFPCWFISPKCWVTSAPFLFNHPCHIDIFIWIHLKLAIFQLRSRMNNSLLIAGGFTVSIVGTCFLSLHWTSSHVDS